MNKISAPLEEAMRQVRQLEAELGDTMGQPSRSPEDLNSIGRKIVELKNALPSELQEELHSAARSIRSEIEDHQVSIKLLEAELSPLATLCRHEGPSPCRHCGATRGVFT